MLSQGLNHQFDPGQVLPQTSAKNLLLNPNLRISEIAYQVAFQSLTHFNRVFKKTVGESPTEFREKLRVR